jgi:hypothetical protein
MKMIVPLVQPLKNIKGEVAVRDGLAEDGQGVGQALHLATIVNHREVTMNEVTECGIEVKSEHVTPCIMVLLISP